MQRPKFINGKLYHLYNRGTDKRKVFLDDQDYFRFIHNLFEFNDTEPAKNIYYKSHEIRTHKIDEEKRARKLIVKIHVFCLMPNHFHLLLEQVRDGGIKEFIRKLCLGYALYFNKKYERVGVLFQGRFKSVLVENDSYFLHLPYYLHANPLDLEMKEWRNRKLKDYKKALEFLKNYRWSSFSDYVGRENFPSVTQRDFLNEFYEGPRNYQKEFQKWLSEMDLENIKSLALE